MRIEPLKQVEDNESKIRDFELLKTTNICSVRLGFSHGSYFFSRCLLQMPLNARVSNYFLTVERLFGALLVGPGISPEVWHHIGLVA